MTMLDKLREEHPEFIGDQFEGGVALCPCDAGYEKETVCHGLKTGEITSEACLKCWNREFSAGGRQ